MALGVVFLVHGNPFGNGESIGNRIPLSKIPFFLKWPLETGKTFCFLVRVALRIRMIRGIPKTVWVLGIENYSVILCVFISLPV